MWVNYYADTIWLGRSKYRSVSVTVKPIIDKSCYKILMNTAETNFTFLVILHIQGVNKTLAHGITYFLTNSNYNKNLDCCKYLRTLSMKLQSIKIINLINKSTNEIFM